MRHTSIVQMDTSDQHLYAKCASTVSDGQSRCAFIAQRWIATRKYWLHVSMMERMNALAMPFNLSIFNCRMYVIGSLPKLEYLDDVKINDDQRAMARAHATVYSANRLTPFQLRETFSSRSNVMTTTKHDAESMRRFGKLMLQQNGSKFDRLWYC